MGELFLFFLFFLFAAGAVLQSPQDVLLNLFDEWNNAGSRNLAASLSTWVRGRATGSGTVCTVGSTISAWYGVECGLDGNLIGLDLHSRAIKGTIPTTIDGLSALTYLRLSHNSLSGTIPSQLATGMPSLVALDLSSNKLTGEIPAQLGGLNALSVIDLNTNDLSGTIPAALCNLNSSKATVDVRRNHRLARFPLCMQRYASSFLADATTTLALYPTGQPTSQPSTYPTAIFARIPSPPSNQPTAFPSETFSLQALYQSCQAAGMTAQQLTTAFSGWAAGISSGFVCNGAVTTWGGVVCSSSGSVIVLSLRGKGLRGSIPAAICGLSALTYLDLADNWLAGVIPSELGSLTALRELALFGNKLTGEIPTTIGYLHALTTLDLHSLWITGSIPWQIGALRWLEFFSLDSTSIASSIPLELYHLTRLKTLILSNTRIEGLIHSSIGSLSELTWLDISSTSVSSSIPAEICLLTNLVSLALLDSRLVGKLPDSLGSLNKLTSIYLNGNRFIGSIPDSLCRLSSSAIIRVDGNPDLTCYPSCLSAYGNFTKDSTLNRTNALETADSKILCDFWNTVSAAGKAKLTNWCGVKNCDGSYLTGACSTTKMWLGIACTLNEAEGVRRVVSINLAGLGLGGGWLPFSVGGLLAVTSIDLYSNGLTGGLPSQLGQLTRLQTLALDTNSLTGPIPTHLGMLTSLERLWLQENSYRGVIPDTLGSIRGLTELYLNGNNLSGTIPVSLCGPRTVATDPWFLYLSANRGLECFSSCFESNPNMLVDAQVVLCSPPTMAPSPAPPPNRDADPLALSPGSIGGIVVACAVVAVMGVSLSDLYWRRRGAQLIKAKVLAEGVPGTDYAFQGRSTSEDMILYPLPASYKPAVQPAEPAPVSLVLVLEDHINDEEDDAAPPPSAPPSPKLAPELMGMRQKMEERMRAQMEALADTNVRLREELECARLRQVNEQ